MKTQRPLRLQNELPELPRLVLRVGFAGSQKLPDQTDELKAKLQTIFQTIAWRLARIWPATEIASADAEPWVRDFYSSSEPPLLRLITGLCEGADALAAQALDAMQQDPASQPEVATELAAVIPFDLSDYRASRPPEFRSEFDRQAARCAYVLVLDGIYEKPQPDTLLAKNRRARAYRAQSTILLRHSDIVIAAADPDDGARAGGTIETVRAALEFERPVVFLHTGTGSISLIEPGDDPASALSALAEGKVDWASMLCSWITTIVAGSDAQSLPEHLLCGHASYETVTSHGQRLLNEFFGAVELPSLADDQDGRSKRQVGIGERLWNLFEGSFRSGPRPISDPPIEPYAAWRRRSTQLNYHYARLYRGAFLLNYALATSTVTLAALSLVLIGYAPAAADLSHTSASEAPPEVVPSASAQHPSGQLPKNGKHAVSRASPDWLLPTLLALGIAKLWIVVWIFFNTQRANNGDWNDKAVEFRYLAERLRSMFYLARIGSFMPPVAAPPQFASRVVRQSAVDWLFDAITRSISPAALSNTQHKDFAFREGTYGVTLVQLEPLYLLKDLRDHWILQQAVYHDRNARTMDRMQTWAENWGRVFNIAVIAFVAVDIVLLVLDLIWVLPQPIAHRLHGIKPWLLFLAAVLPAAVASLNGIRFQAECSRLAERSAAMRAILFGRPPTTRSSSRRSRLQRAIDCILRRPFSFLSSLVPFPSSYMPTITSPSIGSKFAAADRLARRIEAARSNPAADPGSWTPEILRLAESVAECLVQEVAEWSVLYAKDVPEP